MPKAFPLEFRRDVIAVARKLPRELKRRNKLLEQENEILRRATGYFARDVLPK